VCCLHAVRGRDAPTEFALFFGLIRNRQHPTEHRMTTSHLTITDIRMEHLPSSARMEATPSTVFGSTRGGCWTVSSGGIG
jgi:hypothetical protein